MEKLISIIVPVYNVEKYLQKCIESLLNQTYKNIEIILIDDGSTDKSGEICDRYAKTDERIRVVHKKNAGVAAARNDALDMVNGDYITFVDSDDFINEEYCEIFINTLVKNDADIAICQLYQFVEGESIKNDTNELVQNVYSRDEAIFNLISVGRFYECIGGKIFSKRLFEKVRFPLGRRYEDASILHELYFNAKATVVINKKYYYYLQQRDGSIMASYDLSKQKDNYLFLCDRFEYLKNVVPEEQKNLVIAGHIGDILVLLQRSYATHELEIINSEILNKLEDELTDLLKIVDKNVLNKSLSNYKLACLYVFLQDKNAYEKVIDDLYKTRYAK